MSDNDASKMTKKNGGDSQDSPAHDDLSDFLTGRHARGYSLRSMPGDDRAQFVVDTLVRALRQEGYEDDMLLGELREEFLHWLQEQIRRNPKRMAGLLYPVVAPVIGQLIAERLQAFMENTAAVLDMYASPKGLSLRWKSITTGIPLSRLILLNMFVYRVDSVMLVHSKSGMMIRDQHRAQQPLVDTDAIAAMLTAISQFIDDSFGIGEGKPVKDISLGDYRVWMFSGPVVNLAVVVYGRPDGESRRQIRAVLEDIHAIAGRELLNYPNAEVDEAVLDDLLGRCLVERRDPSTQTISSSADDEGGGLTGAKLMRTGAFIAFLGLSALLGWQWQESKWDTRTEQAKLLLRDTHGIVPIEVYRKKKDLYVTALTEKGAQWPTQALERIGFDTSAIHTHLTMVEEFE